MSRVFYCCCTNSTKFTTCCEAAICDDQTHCPICDEEVPYSPNERHIQGMESCYGVQGYAKMQSNLRKKIAKEQRAGFEEVE